MVRTVEGTKGTPRTHYPGKGVALANVQMAKIELDELLNEKNSRLGKPKKYSVSFVRDDKSYTLQVRTKRKEDLGYVDQFLEHGSFWGFKVEKAAVQYKLRME